MADPTDPNLTPGGRVDLIRAAAENLEPRGWNEIDLILDQFGFRTWDTWEGNKNSYLVESLKQGSDENLIGLDAYLHPPPATPTTPQPTTGDPDDDNLPWKTGGFHLFLSHVNAFAEAAGRLRTALAAHSIEAFLAHESIEAGREWQLVIEAALRSCDGLAALMSPGFKESDWTDQELGFVVCRHQLVVPIRAGVTPYGFIGKTQAVKWEGTYPDVADRIFEILLRNPLSRDAMARALVWRFKNSASFAEAQSNVGYLRRIPAEAWSPDLIVAASTAHEHNFQIRQAFWGDGYVKDAVHEIVGNLPPSPAAPTG